jgi:ribosomal protein L37AE/L43A
MGDGLKRAFAAAKATRHPHAVRNRINPKGEEGIWKCARCGHSGTAKDLVYISCSNPGAATDQELLDAIAGKVSK